MIAEIRKQLRHYRKYTSEDARRFFKTEKGQYGSHDKFLGVAVPDVRKIAKQYYLLPIMHIQNLMESKFNEERLLALFILMHRYQKNDDEKEHIYNFYLKNIQHVNNWNLVDSSAHYIIGSHLVSKNKNILRDFAKSKNIWYRRIAIIATWHFIRENKFTETIKISKLLLEDEHDLIHKAVGWMLREMGKRNQACLAEFLQKYAKKMPRTMLRYAIEKFPEAERRKYLLA
ncbi:MAG: DNA alkylation repair protein [Coxiellaceae bacterium]|nr:DNA alkylation repair protein [Coxiellaceae bacterium]